MQLLAREERVHALDAEYAGEGNPVLKLKFFDPCGSWTWYAVDGQPVGNDYEFYGFVKGFESEWGYFSLNELEEFVGKLGVGIERDLYFISKPFSELTDLERGRY